MTAFVSSFTAGTTRTGNLIFGYKFTTGAAALSVSSLGRINLAGSTGAHTVTIARISDGVVMASASITADGAGGMKYTPISAVTLAASTAYRIYGTENTDSFYDSTAGVAATGTIDGSEYSTDSGATFVPVAGGSNIYGPYDFLYGVGSALPRPTRALQAVHRASVR